MSYTILNIDELFIFLTPIMRYNYCFIVTMFLCHVLLVAIDAHLTYTPISGCCLNYENANMSGDISPKVLTDIPFNVCESNLIFCNQITYKIKMTLIL